jgi:hypothetical protein
LIGTDVFKNGRAWAAPKGAALSCPPKAHATLERRPGRIAARELERAVKDLGLKGWKTHSNYGDSYLDQKVFWPVLAKAE